MIDLRATSRRVWILGTLSLVLLLAIAFAVGRRSVRRVVPVTVTNIDAGTATAVSAGTAPTTVYAHNILLRKGPQFRIYIRWIRGQMLRTRHDVDPSFDDPGSFVLLINKGVIDVHLQDLAAFLNSGSGNATPLKNVSIQADGNDVELHGTVHKIIPVPVKIKGQLTPLPDGRVRFHVASYSLLKVPMKGFLHLFSVKLSDLVPSSGVPGVQISGNDILFDTQHCCRRPTSTVR